ncbi:phage tail tape measure C-terminal domain-containing protein, partial [Stenotrophomonas lactitubi]|uniref:phage tail tape measure C-terminal domain-containing protein n=1 Tax=Stenotrophomonas lactitubi TaxID=2045214 RepID=UPI00320B9442
DLRLAEGNWLAGAGAAWANYQQEAGNYARQMGDTVTTVIGGFEDAWVRFTTTGKLSFSDLTKSVLADLARIAARQAIMGIANAVAGAWGSSGVTAAGNEAVNTGTSSINNELFQKMKLGGGYSKGGYTGDGAVNEPAGVVHKGEVVWSQKDVARAGGLDVVEAMRKGLKGYDTGGVVGASGAGVGRAGGLNIQGSLTINASEQDSDQPEVTDKQIRDSFTGAINEWAVRNLRPGGVLYKAGYRA